MTAGDWATTIVGIVGSLVAIGIAVASALRDNRLRQRDSRLLADRDQQAEERRARQEAEKLVFVYEPGYPAARWRVTNASEGPVLDIEIRGGTDASNNHPDFHLRTDGSVLRLLQSRDTTSVTAFWYDSSGTEISSRDLPLGATPIATWRDAAGRVWVRDGHGLRPMPPGKD